MGKGRRLSKEQSSMVRDLFRLGYGKAQIAELTGVSERSVYRYIGSGDQDGAPIPRAGAPLAAQPAEKPDPQCLWEEHKARLSRRIPLSALQRDYKPVLMERIRGLAAADRNLVIGIDGALGNGKSLLGLYICRLIDPLFGVQNVIFTKADLSDRISKGTAADGALLVDDAGVILDARSWQERERAQIYRFIELCRHHRVSVVFTMPNLSMMDSNLRRTCHLLINVVLRCGADHVHAIVFEPSNLGGKIDFHPVGVARFELAEYNQFLVMQYEARKREGLAKALAEAEPKTELRGNEVGFDDEALEGYLSYARSLAGLDRREASQAINEATKGLPEGGRRQTRGLMLLTYVQARKQVEQEARLSSARQKYLDGGFSERFAAAFVEKATNGWDDREFKKLVFGLSGVLDEFVSRGEFEEFLLEHQNDPNLVYVLRQLVEALEFLLKLFKGGDETLRVFCKRFFDSPDRALKAYKGVKREYRGLENRRRRRRELGLDKYESFFHAPLDVDYDLFHFDFDRELAKLKSDFRSALSSSPAQDGNEFDKLAQVLRVLNESEFFKPTNPPAEIPGVDVEGLLRALEPHVRGLISLFAKPDRTRRRVAVSSRPAYNKMAANGLSAYSPNPAQGLEVIEHLDFNPASRFMKGGWR